jgi:hypothetical protein
MADLESVIVGGAIAIAGGLATGFLLEFFKQRAEKKKKKAEKLEELIAVLYEYQNEVGKKESTNVYAKVQAITLIHFPILQEYIAKLGEAAFKYEQDMLKIDADTDIEKGPIADIRFEFLTRFTDALLSIIEYANREFQ